MSPVGLSEASNSAAAETPTVVTLGEFAAVDEPGAAPLLGDETGALIPEGGDVLLYGDGGAGKTTLTVDLAFHMAAGVDWLGIRVARPTRILLIENEGPRPLLRQKLRRKIAAWENASADGRISILESPWARFSFADVAWRDLIAEQVRELEIDVLIVGPLTRVGMDAAGTLQEVVAFHRLVGDVRERSGRPLTVFLVHHENKAGAVSGAWEGAGDTLLHMSAAGNGHSILFVQKARWASEWHQKTLKLAWAPGDSFQIEGDRDYVAEIEAFLAARPWRTAKEIAAPTDADEPGIGAGEKTIREVLAQHPDAFTSRTCDDAKAVGRSARATVYALSSAQNSVNSVGASKRSAEGDCVTASVLKGRSTSERTPSPAGATELRPQLSGSSEPLDADAELERLQAKFPELTGDEGAAA